jgi:hypothetical protein
LWDTIERVTGQPVKFKFIHGTGLCAILVDGCKPQVDACGDDLVKQNQLEISGIHETDPQVIVQYIVGTCTVHLDRYARSSVFFRWTNTGPVLQIPLQTTIPKMSLIDFYSSGSWKLKWNLTPSRIFVRSRNTRNFMTGITTKSLAPGFSHP